MEEGIIQAIGIIGAALFVISYQIFSNKALYRLQLIGSGLFCLQFLMMGAFSGCANLAVNLVRNAMLSKYTEWAWVRWKGWAAIMIAIYSIILVATWNGLPSLLPYAAAAGSTLGYWTNNAQKLRLSNLACASPCWMIYDIIVGSWGGVLSEAITMIAIIVSIIRYGWREMGEQNFGS